MLLIVDGPPRASPLEREPYLTCLADHRLEQLSGITLPSTAPPYVAGQEACSRRAAAEPAVASPGPMAGLDHGGDFLAGVAGRASRAGT